MKPIAEDLYLLDGRPPQAINVYLAGEVLIDAATRQAEQRILRQLAGRSPRTHVLTHVHPDHQGSSHAVCERFEVPLWCGRSDIPAMERPGAVASPKEPRWLRWLHERYWSGPPHPVSRALIEGDEVAGFRVLETPGHTPGHLAFWRESDRVLILGDVLNNMNLITGRPGLHEPPAMFTADPERNRASARRLAELRPDVACFGHGPALRDPDLLERFVRGLGG
jgi:hydroxyacylglutathione hydrolase